MPSKETVRFNTKRVVYAVIIEDSKTKFEHGPIKDFGPIKQMQFTPTVASGTDYGRGVKMVDISRLTGGELVIDQTKLAIEVKAEIYNFEYENGVLSEKVGTQPKDIAIGIEIEQTDDCRELCWFFKGKPRMGAQTVQQTTDNFNFSQDSITIGLVQRKFDGKLRAYGDTSNADFTDEAAGLFLDTIPGGTLIEGGGGND
jgi:phi13 family phage major tail protein